MDCSEVWAERCYRWTRIWSKRGWKACRRIDESTWQGFCRPNNSKRGWRGQAWFHSPRYLPYWCRVRIRRHFPPHPHARRTQPEPRGQPRRAFGPWILYTSPDWVLQKHILPSGCTSWTDNDCFGHGKSKGWTRVIGFSITWRVSGPRRLHRVGNA